MQTLISHGIALFSAHTNADHATPGVSDALGQKLAMTDLRPLVPTEGEPNTGTGRVGELPETLTLEQFAELVATALPQTAHGVRVAGDPMTPVRTVAVCGEPEMVSWRLLRRWQMSTSHLICDTIAPWSI